MNKHYPSFRNVNSAATIKLAGTEIEKTLLETMGYVIAPLGSLRWLKDCICKASAVILFQILSQCRYTITIPAKCRPRL